MLVQLSATVVILLMASLPLAAALPEAAVVLDSDIAWDVANPECFSISPDGKLVAYISSGAIWYCSLEGGPPQKLADLSKSVTAFLAHAGNESWRKQAAGMPLVPSYSPVRGAQSHKLRLIFSLAWTPSQDGVYYTARTELKDHSTLAAFQVMHVSLDGEVKEIARFEREYVVYYDSGTNLRVSRDGKYIVISNYGTPLIWDIKAKAPRATCFDFLIPSASSGRWLGVEIDTRQLVLADADFRIIKRFDVHFPQQRRCKLVWSADERYAVCLTRAPYSSHKTKGLRIELQNGMKTRLAEGVIRDQYYFTGKLGELVRLGITGVPPNGFGEGGHGAYISVLADNTDEQQVIIRFAGPPRKPRNWRDKKPYPPILGAADGSSFAIALPRPQAEAAGFHYHLVDRSGTCWPFLPVKKSSYNTPYYPLAFTDNGQTILARVGSRLFTLSIASIKEGASND